MLRIACLAAGVIGFAVTLLPRGATLIYLWPWPLILTIGLAVPPAMFLVRLVRGEAAPRPGGPAGWLMAAFAVVLLLSTMLSPYRGAAAAIALMPLAAIALFFEVIAWRRIDDQTDSLLERALAWMLVVFTIDSLVLWLATIVIPNGFVHLWEARNPHPLGHSNYTAGAILLLLPFGIARAWRMSGRQRGAWSFAVLLALFCLFTAGSRAAILGLGAAAIVGGALLVRARLLPARRALLVAGICCAGAAIFAVANPRIRDMLRPSPDVVPDDSTLQRRAMLDVGERLIAARPVLGWGPGTTPLAYPRFRADVAGGVDTALQLHDTPVQIAADLGVTGLALSLALAIVTGVATWRSCGDPNQAHRLPVAAVAGTALAAYGVFAIYDFELDVPLFIFVVAIAAALV
ncbi:MAG TPA: O-antigen ligase family protein, partial [Candidatus Didemnitutus sp.]